MVYIKYTLLWLTWICNATFKSLHNLCKKCFSLVAVIRSFWSCNNCDLNAVIKFCKLLLFSSCLYSMPVFRRCNSIISSLCCSIRNFEAYKKICHQWVVSSLKIIEIAAYVYFQIVDNKKIEVNMRRKKIYRLKKEEIEKR